MGTALTEQQVDAIARLAPKALFCQDPDTRGPGVGGQARTRGAAQLHNSRSGATRGVEFRIVRLPAGQDPADVVQRVGRRGDARAAGRRRCRSSASRSSGRWSSRDASTGRDARRRGAGDRAAAARACCATSSCGSSRTGSACGEQLVNEVLRAVPVGRRRARRAGGRRRLGERGGRPWRQRARAAASSGDRERGAAEAAAIAFRSDDAARARRPARGAGPARAERAGVPRATASRCPRRASSGWPRPTSRTTSPRPRPARPRRTCAGACARPRPTCRRATRPSPAWSPSSWSAPARSRPRPAKLELEALQLDLHRLERHISEARLVGRHGGVGALAAERQRVLDEIRHRLT